MVTEQAVTDELTGPPNNRAFRDVDRQGGGAGGALPPRPLAADARHRRLQAGQRHLRPPPGRRGAARGRPDPRRRVARHRRAGPLRRRGVRRRAPGDGRRRARTSSASGSGRGSRPSRFPCVDGKGEIRVTASFGAATMPAAGLNVTDLIAAADAALYEAKRAGKNRVVVAEGNGMGWRTDAE